ncbi:MAG: efflux RND transporter periplasmic adaptor subunit [Lentimicrobium sp.]|jgi:membrane fusion protein (multidrug efflux system)|nr:efflux RND transporter periplasmic adaptor subunit [Lentimicrobium sp.]
MNKHLKRTLSLTITVLIILFLVGYKAGWFSAQSKAEKNPASAQNEALPINVIIVNGHGLTDQIVATGTVLADEQVDISPEISGRLTSVLFTEGAAVNKGDCLATINDSELLAQIERNRYVLKLAEEREARQKALLTREAVSQEVYDKSLTELNTVQAEASLLEAQLMKTRIKAPFSGTVGLRQVSEGAYVTPGQRIATLTRTQPVKIEFSIPERFAQSVRKGSRIQFTIEGNSKTLEASVYAVEPRIDPLTRALTVRALYPNRNNEMNPGSFARVEFSLNHMDNALTVPAQAIVPELGGNKVFLYRSGLVKSVQVSVGIRTSDAVQIIEGISEGDTVITTGILQIREGMPVTIDQLTTTKP